MKKLLILFIAVLALSLSACTPSGNGPDEERTYELALITDVGTINDKSFNQGAWEGLKKYAEEHNISYKYYQPASKDTQQYINSITLAVDNGAKVVVTPGFLFEPAIYEAQDTFPDVKFVLLDGFPNDGDWSTGAPTARIEDNVYSIFYAEEEVGFLAGYAAVKEGYRELGFMGGMAVPAVIRFGYGFVDGAEYAAKELDVEVNIQYTYLGDFEPSAAHQTQAASWYESGVEVIFAAAGGAGNSVMKAAEDAGKYVIGVDVDQSSESSSIITSATKGLAVSVYLALEGFYADNFRGGKSDVLDVTVDGVSLPDDFSKFENFTKADYDAIYDALVKDTGGIRSSITNDEDVESADQIKTEKVTVKVS